MFAPVGSSWPLLDTEPCTSFFCGKKNQNTLFLITEVVYFHHKTFGKFRKSAHTQIIN